MSSSTTNYSLVKPAYDETADIAVINTNMDTLDSVIGAKVLAVTDSISIPAQGTSNAVSRNLEGLTSDHVLVLWRFSTNAENDPPVNLTCSTNNGYFTITNTGGTPSGSCRPVFAIPIFKASSTH